MAWDDYARTDFDADKAVRTGRAATLHERNELLGETPLENQLFTEQTTNATVYTSLITFTIWVPDYADGWSLKVLPEVKVDAGTGAWRIYNSTRAVDGTEVTGITNTGYQDSASASAVTIATADLEVLTGFGIKGKIDNGANTFFIRNDNRLTFWFEAP